MQAWAWGGGTEAGGGAITMKGRWGVATEMLFCATQAWSHICGIGGAKGPFPGSTRRHLEMG